MELANKQKFQNPITTDNRASSVVFKAIFKIKEEKSWPCVNIIQPIIII
jgi:hypothetical protein